MLRTRLASVRRLYKPHPRSNPHPPPSPLNRQFSYLEQFKHPTEVNKILESNNQAITLQENLENRLEALDALGSKTDQEGEGETKVHMFEIGSKMSWALLMLKLQLTLSLGFMGLFMLDKWNSRRKDIEVLRENDKPNKAKKLERNNHMILGVFAVHCFASLYANQKFNLYRLKFIKNIYWSPKSNLFELTMFNGQKTVSPNKIFTEIYTNEKTMKKVVNYKVDLGQ